MKLNIVLCDFLFRFTWHSCHERSLAKGSHKCLLDATVQICCWFVCRTGCIGFISFLENYTDSVFEELKVTHQLNVHVYRGSDMSTTIKYHTWPRIPHEKVTKIQLNITKAEMSALSQHVTTRQQWPDAEVCQTQDIDNTNDPQKKYRLGTVSKNVLLEGLNQFHVANLAFTSDVDQDTVEKLTKHKKTQHTRKPRGQLFPSRWPQGCKEQTRQHNTHQHET